LIGWIVTTAFLLGLVYQWDRAGWIWFQITGYNLTRAEDFSDLVNLSAVDFMKRNSFFSIASQDSTKLIVHKGEYEIDETIVIPKSLSLTIEPGTVLRFKVGRSLISYSPIIAAGTESEPIRFTAQNKWRKWGVVGVVNAAPSVFEHVIFEHGRQACVNDIDFFGCLSLIATDVEITNSQFLNLCGKDAAYVKQGRVSIHDNIFRNTFKDGLDLDGGAGEVSHNQFINCGDEGIDLSENDHLVVLGNEVIDSRGGRIAAEQNLEQIRLQNSFGRLDATGATIR